MRSFVTVLLSGIVLASRCKDATSCFSEFNQFSNNDTSSCSNTQLVAELYTKLQDNNFDIINTTFTNITHKLCINITYEVTCPQVSNETCEKGDGLQNSALSCGRSYKYNVMWIKFGFPWKLILTLWMQYKKTPICRDGNITLNIPDLDCSIGSKDALHKGLVSVSEYMVAIQKGHDYSPNEQELNNAIGSSDSTTSLTITLLQLFIAASAFLLVMSNKVRSLLAEAINTSETGKPKMYFHFWSAMITSFIIACYYFLRKDFRLNHSFPQGTELSLIVTAAGYAGYMLLCGCMSMCKCVSKRKRTSRNGNLPRTKSAPYSLQQVLSVPFISLVPTVSGKFIWRHLITFIGLAMLSTVVALVISYLPILLLIFYYDPVKTSVHISYAIGAIFGAVTLISQLIYMVEYFIELTKFMLHNSWLELGCRLVSDCIWNCCSCFHTNCNNCRLVKCFASYVKHSGTSQDHTHHSLHYGIQMKEDYSNKKHYRSLNDMRFSYWFYPIKILAMSYFTGLYLLAHWVLADMIRTFPSSSDQYINIIVAILHSVLVIGGVWLGGGVIFDLRIDLRTMDPRKKSSEMEKLTRAVEELTSVTEELIEQRKKRDDRGGGRTSIPTTTADPPPKTLIEIYSRLIKHFKKT